VENDSALGRGGGRFYRAKKEGGTQPCRKRMYDGGGRVLGLLKNGWPAGTGVLYRKKKITKCRELQNEKLRKENVKIEIGIDPGKGM